MKNLFNYLKKFKKRTNILLLLLLVLHITCRLYQLETVYPFGWDQVNNAWAAKGILVDNNYPLRGMVAKNNSGIYIGPLYYYLITPFYFFTNLDPIASSIFAVVTSLITSFILYFITKKIFGRNVAYIVFFINAVSFSGIDFDRVQWPVAYIPATSILIFYFLYKIITGKSSYIVALAASVGFSMHIHFTSIFYPIIILLSLPFFPRNKDTIKYCLLGLLLYLTFLIPNIILEVTKTNSSGGNLLHYINTYFHGLHLTRVLQLTKDAFIQFDPLLLFSFLKFLKYLLVPLFFVYFYVKHKSFSSILFIYLMGLWFIVPWIIFSVYSGEITDYYFSSTRYFTFIIVGYFTYELIKKKNMVINILLITLTCVYLFFSIQKTYESRPINLKHHREAVKSAIKQGRTIEFVEGSGASYLYYVVTRN